MDPSGTVAEEVRGITITTILPIIITFIFHNSLPPSLPVLRHWCIAFGPSAKDAIVSYIYTNSAIREAMGARNPGTAEGRNRRMTMLNPRASNN